jgi:hypothetical protein
MPCLWCKTTSAHFKETEIPKDPADSAYVLLYWITILEACVERGDKRYEWLSRPERLELCKFLYRCHTSNGGFEGVMSLVKSPKIWKIVQGQALGTNKDQAKDAEEEEAEDTPGQFAIHSPNLGDDLDTLHKMAQEACAEAHAASENLMSYTSY